MLALRQFDSRPASDKTYPDIGSTTIEFGTPPRDSVLAFVTSFAHPVHVDSFPSETDSDASVDDGTEWRELDVRGPARGMPTCEGFGPVPSPPSALAPSV